MPAVTPFGMDGGHDKIKVSAPTGVLKEDAFAHLFAKISANEYTRISRRADASLDDYFIVNGQYYVIGQKAKRYNPYDVQEGANRYTPEYYGVLAAIAMMRGFRKSKKAVFFVGSHAPGDSDYADDLMRSVVGLWRVVWREEEYEFRVVDATTLEEPLCGYYNAILRHDGRAYVDKQTKAGTTLVIDVGAKTTDGAVIDPNGEIDGSSLDSTDIGVRKRVNEFMDDFRTANSAMLKGVKLDDSMAQEALRTGEFDLRGLGVYSCENEAQEIRNALAYDVVNFYAGYGGAAYYNTIVLTGGGTALLEKELRGRIAHNRMIFADKQVENMHMANVRGLMKWYWMHEMLGTFA